MQRSCGGLSVERQGLDAVRDQSSIHAPHIDESWRAGDVSLDIEFGNVHGFYSAARQALPLRELSRGRYARSQQAHLTEAAILLNDEVTMTDMSLNRTLSFTMQAASHLYDMVSRFVIVDRTGERPAWIAGRVLQHQGASRYWQYPCGRVVVPVGKQEWLCFEGSVQGIEGHGMDHVVYLKDEPAQGGGTRWVLHHRLIAQEQGNVLKLRGCHPRYNEAFPLWLDALVPTVLKRRLFRIRETHLPHSPVMAVAHVPFLANERVTLTSRLELRRGDAPF